MLVKNLSKTVNISVKHINVEFNMTTFITKYQDLHDGLGEYIDNGKIKEAHEMLFTGANFVNKLWPIFKHSVYGFDHAVNVVDWGCGKALHLCKPVLEGKTLYQALAGSIQSYYCYDPGYQRYSGPPVPNNQYDILICADVLEHIPLEEVEDTINLMSCCLTETGVALFTISGKPAKKQFSSGENMHCTVLPLEEWIDILQHAFGNDASVLIIYDGEEGEQRWSNSNIFEKFL